MSNPSLASLSFKGLTGHWSKWGGNIQSVLTNQSETFDHWFCQSCRREMGKELQPYFYEFPKGEYIRICAVCLNEGCVILEQRTVIIEETIEENPLLLFIK